MGFKIDFHKNITESKFNDYYLPMLKKLGLSEDLARELLEDIYFTVAAEYEH